MFPWYYWILVSLAIVLIASLAMIGEWKMFVYIVGMILCASSFTLLIIFVPVIRSHAIYWLGSLFLLTMLFGIPAIIIGDHVKGLNPNKRW